MPPYINGDCVERVTAFKFLGVHISETLSWTINILALTKKAQQRLHFLRIIRKSGLEERLLVSFYQSPIQSVFSYSITTWYAGSSAGDKISLQRVINLAQKIIGCPLPSLEEISSTRCLKRAGSIVSDSSHPAHHIFDLLPSGRHFRSIKTRTSRLRDSFFPWAIRTLNNPTMN